MEVEYSYDVSERTKRLIAADTAYFKSLANKHKLLMDGANDIETLNDMLDLLGSGEGFYDTSSPFNSVEIRKIITETLVVNYWEYFFKSDDVLPIHRQIRNELLDRKEEEGLDIPIESSSYQDFKQWVSGIFGTYQPKVMYALYFAKFHHCSNASEKLSILLHVPPNIGVVTGYNLHIISNSCPNGVVIGDDMAFVAPDLIMVDRLMIGSYDIVTNDVARRTNFKELVTSVGYPVSISFYLDENGDRMAKFDTCTKCSVLASTSCNLENADPNFISQFIILSDAGKTPVKVGVRL